MKNKPPIGVMIFAGINSLFFGLITLFVSLSVFFVPSVQEKVQTAFQYSDPVLSSVTSPQLRAITGIQAFLSILYIVLGVGLFFRKELARRVTIYFSFVLLIMVFISAITQPSLITQCLVNAIYPALLIVYFTKKKVEEWFRQGENNLRG